MFTDRHWGTDLPMFKTAVHTLMTSTGSLTEKLIATGHPFAVELLYQGPSQATADEAGLLGDDAQSWVYARQVALSLDSVMVVVARSIIRSDCPVWLPVLQRGNRSLGLTLFGPDSEQIQRGPLHYQQLNSGPLFTLARLHDPDPQRQYLARRSSFMLDHCALNVCEVFLPALETFL